MDTFPITGRAYRPRLTDLPLRHALESAGAVVLEGARAVGKTMTGLNAANSYIFLDDAAVRDAVDIAPAALLEGVSPRLLDEWQLAPELWNMVRRAVDFSPELGRFILTGSAVPADDVTRHTGAGRFLRLRQQTMTWWEKFGPAEVPVSLAGLFDGDRPRPDFGQDTNLDRLVDNLLRPGFPALTDLALDQAAARLRAYIAEVSRTDISRLADIRHSPAVIQQLIAALARSVASEVSYQTLASDIRAVAPAIDRTTVSTYVGLLERLFVVESQQAWTPSLRSRARLRTTPRLHLVDPALAAAAIGAGSAQLRADLPTLGVLFESAVVHDLTAFAGLWQGEVRHYRDSNGREIDAIVTRPDGRWGAVEIKLGARQASDGIASLNRAVADIDTASVGEPAFRLVVTGMGATFTADDGTVTCPLRSLAP